ncbi:MAG: hypothetical protein IPM56_05320 [Ignavibacteriales bacterium]|nr:MAG: hypothetical protein IPM56_05320 [Ignavibacteriales bacterium]
MTPKVLSTYRILYKKAFNEDIDESWIDWAVEMMLAGYESDSLYILAGISKPYNQFELQELTHKVLSELNLEYKDKHLTIRNYAYYIISNTVAKPENYLATLKELKDICLGLDYDQEYMNFYLLYFAKEDLNESENQWYWDDANRSNIDTIIKEQFLNYIKKIDNSTKS